MTGSPMPWISVWLQASGVDPGIPPWAMAALGLAFTFGFLIFPSGMLVVYLDRKLTADFQARIGPNRAGLSGLLQPFADLLKLLQKENVSPWSWREFLWLNVHTMALYSTVAVIPFGSLALLINTDMSAFLPLWAAMVLALGTLLLGLSHSTVPGWLGGIRVVAQALSGSFPALISILCAGVRAGGFRWSTLAESQGGTPFHWAAMSNPFQFLAFIIFVVSGLIFLGIPPMDGAYSVVDIHGGVSSHLSGRRLSLFRLGKFYGFFLWSIITVVTFLGAWILPFGFSDLLREAGQNEILQLLELLWLLVKVFSLMVLVIWVARVNPRSRVDQITDFSWKVLSPFALVALIGATLWAGWRILE